ncbi:MAG: hypothetical protein K6U74_07800 [Firmicutes bacterium]|nr:hypothetical protein [Bacillota bacterium]
MKLYIFWRKYKGKKARYAALYEPSGEKGLPKMVYYLGKDPEAKLRKLLEEGKLTPEQVALITSPEAAALVEEVKERLAPTWCEKAKDHCQLKAGSGTAGKAAGDVDRGLAHRYEMIRGIVNLYGDDPARAIKKIREVMNDD